MAKNNFLAKLHAWRLRRKQRELERWERVRAQGKAWWVLHTALAFALTLVGLTDLYERLFRGEASISWRMLIVQLVTGIIIAPMGWDAREAKYNKALTQARVNALPGGQLPSRDNSLRITANSKSN